jgi:ATP-dependent exoDNAse (exonuclease V) beta subunit
MEKKTVDYLAIKNEHPRDKHIVFDEGPHIYTVNGEQGYTSVTTWNHSHFEEFDTDKIINGILKNKKMSDPTYKYFGMSKEQILEMWDKNKDEAAKAGTKMHYDIECYYNNIDNENTSIEFEYFKEFEKDHADLIPYRTEWCVYYEELKISGSIDMIFENSDGDLLIFDWKRVKELNYDDHFGNKKAKTKCISHMPDTNFWHYSLQLNLYKTILEHKYDKKVVGLYLVCLHPDNFYRTYEKYEVPFLDKEMRDLIDFRKEQLKNA